MDDRFDKKILERDEKVIDKIDRLEEDYKEKEDRLADSKDGAEKIAKEKARLEKKEDKILKDAQREDWVDEVHQESYNERLNAYENSKIDRRDEAESRRTKRQTDFLNLRDEFDEKVVKFFDDHDQKKIQRLLDKETLDDHDKEEIERLREKIAKRDSDLKDKEQERVDELSQKQADQIDEVLNRDEKDFQKEVK